MAHGKKAYGKGLISKDRSQGILQTFAHFPHKKKTAGSEKRNCHLFLCLYMYFISQLSRRARFKILPVAFFGRASRGIKRLGIL